MKNVVINKIVKFIFTEDQMRSAWKSRNTDLDFDSLSDEQLMTLAEKIREHASHSDLEHHTLGSVWRTESEFEGKVLAEDDSDPSRHVELVDTSASGNDTKVFIDRMLRLNCKDCGFEFFVEDLDCNLSSLKCPKDGGAVEKSTNTEKQVKKK